MKRSITKRLKITKNGKVVRRPMGIDHFRAKRSGKRVRNTRKSRGIDRRIDFQS